MKYFNFLAVALMLNFTACELLEDLLGDLGPGVGGQITDSETGEPIEGALIEAFTIDITKVTDLDYLTGLADPQPDPTAPTDPDKQRLVINVDKMEEYDTDESDADGEYKIPAVATPIVLRVTKKCYRTRLAGVDEETRDLRQTIEKKAYLFVEADTIDQNFQMDASCAGSAPTGGTNTPSVDDTRVNTGTWTFTAGGETAAGQEVDIPADVVISVSGSLSGGFGGQDVALVVDISDNGSANSYTRSFQRVPYDDTSGDVDSSKFALSRGAYNRLSLARLDGSGNIDAQSQYVIFRPAAGDTGADRERSAFVATLTWDTGSPNTSSNCDMDLHAVDVATGSEIAYYSKSQEFGELDIDNVWGLGPENIYFNNGQNLTEGVNISIHAYSCSIETNVEVRVQFGSVDQLYRATFNGSGEYVNHDYWEIGLFQPL